MKRLKGLDEIHGIMENIYEEEKDLNPEQRVKKYGKSPKSFY